MASNGMLDSRGNILNPFTIPSVAFILRSASHHDHHDVKVNKSTAYDDAYQYLPGGDEWTKI